jgi:glycerophosphoryl diester phosphodiesterase
MLERDTSNTDKVLVVSHRGAMGHAPENTMASFRKGYELKADMIELDIQMSKDRELVVIHDGDVSRTTGGKGHIRDMTMEDIRSLEAGSHFSSAFKGEKIPILREVLSWAKDKIPLAIEIKGDPQPAEGIEERLVTLLQEYNMINRVMVISFHHASLKRLKEMEPSVATGIIYYAALVDTVAVARAAKADSIHPGWKFCTASMIEKVHRAGLAVYAWAANDEEEMKHLIKMGIDAIGTNYPDRLHAVLDTIDCSSEHRKNHS